MNQVLQLSNKVKTALANKRPVIALESTIISHGMPYPQNVETALACEAVAREHGAEPATIAVINGKLCAGLTQDQIEYLGKTGSTMRKASRRDLPYLIATRQDGATTVAATMIIAAMAGIAIFATGGVGGVHRGAEVSMDISADLEELANTSVAVVCAGAKSILDLGLTLEYLETKGVPVIGYKTDVLPAFYTNESSFRVPIQANTVVEIARMILAQRALAYPGGMLIANPIPAQYSMPAAHINQAIDQALQEAQKLGVKGKDVTPFLLARVVDITGGASLKANIQLVFNNVALAAQIASAMSEG
ncbi:MAG: pseudouridine-5'-phosphate glycosidase [Clostridiales bacterium]|nr:pseudouridine-5'-phosphate glycosidase [Clostridiales bacterium]